MKKIIATLTITLAITLSIFGISDRPSTTYDPSVRHIISATDGESSMQVAGHYVRGYVKSNGTYVSPYYRSSRYESYDKYGNYKY